MLVGPKKDVVHGIKNSKKESFISQSEISQFEFKLIKSQNKYRIVNKRMSFLTSASQKQKNNTKNGANVFHNNCTIV